MVPSPPTTEIGLSLAARQCRRPNPPSKSRLRPLDPRLAPCAARLSRRGLNHRDIRSDPDVLRAPPTALSLETKRRPPTTFGKPGMTTTKRNRRVSDCGSANRALFRWCIPTKSASDPKLARHLPTSGNGVVRFPWKKADSSHQRTDHLILTKWRKETLGGSCVWRKK